MNQEIVEVSFDTFIEHYAPFPPSDEDVSRCLARLVEKDLAVSQPGNAQFTRFQRPPSTGTGTEKDTYGRLSDICSSIREVAVTNRAASCLLVQEPIVVTASDTRGGFHAIDGYFKPVSSTVPQVPGKDDKTATFDVAVNCEWKLQERDYHDVRNTTSWQSQPTHANQNRSKVVFAAVHVMNNDPRRTHMYSVRIDILLTSQCTQSDNMPRSRSRTKICVSGTGLDLIQRSRRGST